MTVEVFVQCLKTLARYVEVLPHVAGIQAPISMMTHIKNIIYKAMHVPWQVQFLRSFHNVANINLLELQNFMANKRLFADGSQGASGSSVPNTGPHYNSRNP
jgi:hypothetical protein